MIALDWLRDGAPQATRPIYAIFGNDHYLVRESIATIVRAAFPEPDSEPAISRFSGAQAGLADVLDELFTLPFFSRRRLVIVEDGDPFVSRHRRELEAYTEAPSKTAVLILQVKQWPATTKLAKLVEKVGLAIDCNALGDKNSARLVSWLIEYSRVRCGAQLESGAAHLLVELVGPEIGILASEVEKLAVYAGDSRQITRADVARMVDAGRVETVWKALDAATTGQGQKALELLDNLLASGENTTLLLAAMSASLLKIHHAGQLRAARIGLDEACQMAGIPSFAVKKTGEQHAHLGPRRVDQLPASLLRVDLDLKGGSAIEPRILLELFLVGLARPRAD